MRHGSERQGQQQPAGRDRAYHEGAEQRRTGSGQQSHRLEEEPEDPTDDEFLAGTDVPALMAVAYDRLREYGYSLWTWNAANGAADDDVHAGWITLSRDDEAMRALAAELGIELRAGSDAF